MNELNHADDSIAIDIPDINSRRRHSSPNSFHLPGNSLPCFDRLQGILSDEDFRTTVASVQEAIECGIQPIRISQGSSGSYFVRNKNGKIVGVFKPKNEEPYGSLNPKWIKWLHKTCCPCFFGRSCLIANLGYISEAAASVLDRQLGLNIVPRTEVVELASSAFNYSWIDRKQKDKKGLPKKIGSFQIFLTGYKDSGTLIKDFVDQTIGEQSIKQFQFSFERLVILDYLMRNTDRGMDNWMLYYGRPDDDEAVRQDKSASTSLAALESSWHVVSSPIVRVAGIDNGLAFPHKHPDKWRSYPYGWAWLPFARVPFSEETRKLFLPKLSDIHICEKVIEDLRRVFMLDCDFDPDLFDKQMAVFRGQWHNLVESLQLGECPFELIKRPLMMIYEEDGVFPADPEDSFPSRHHRLHPIVKRWKKMLVQVEPFFSGW